MNETCREISSVRQLEENELRIDFDHHLKEKDENEREREEEEKRTIE